MIVLDASAVVEALVGAAPPPVLLDVIAAEFAAPHLLDVEVLSALRGLELGHRLDPDLARDAVETLVALQIDRHDASLLAPRIWELRLGLGAYDAAYLALAELLDAPLLTCDRNLVGGAHRANVRLLPRS